MDSIWGDHKRHFNKMDGEIYGKNYENKFYLVIEALQDLKVSFIPSGPVTLNGPGDGMGDAISLPSHKICIDTPSRLASSLKKAIPIAEDRLCFISPECTTRWNPENQTDNSVHIRINVGSTKQELAKKELDWFYNIKNNIGMHFVSRDWPETVVSMRTWLKANEEFLHGGWKDFPELDRNL